MLLYIYLGTTAYVWFDSIKSMIQNNKRLKKEGYKFNVKKFNGVGDIIVFIIYGLAMSIPLFNLMFVVSNHDKEKSYDEYKNMLLDAGSIEEPETYKHEESTKKPIVLNRDNKYQKVVFKDGKALVKENTPIKIEYIGNIDNIKNLFEEHKEIEAKKRMDIIDVNDSSLKVRTNRDGHIYYSSKEEDYEVVDYSSHVYKKELKKRRY